MFLKDGSVQSWETVYKNTQTTVTSVRWPLNLLPKQHVIHLLTLVVPEEVNTIVEKEKRDLPVKVIKRKKINYEHYK